MKLDIEFEQAAVSSAEDIWSMIDRKDYNDDIWGHYMGMLSYLDIINYMNGNTFDDPIQTRHAIAYMGFSMPSLAYINPFKTRELSYLLNLVNINLPSKHLVMRISGYFSDNVLMVQKAFAAALYRTVSGRDMYDGDFHVLADKIYNTIKQNGESSQEVWGIETLPGRFEVLPNAIALMVFELHDKFFGTSYSKLKPEVLSFIQSKLKDPDTGLYYESYHTGLIGYQNEYVNTASAYRTDILKPSVNGLALTFMHYFDAKEVERAWSEYKAMFEVELMSLSTEDIVGSLGKSFQSHLGPASEDLFAALLAAKEMDDKGFFEKLQKHLFDIGSPCLREGQIFYNGFEDGQHLMGFFLLFARTHVGWNKLLKHPWQNYYHYDYKEVR